MLTELHRWNASVNNDVQEMRANAEAAARLGESNRDQISPLAHRIGHAAIALGEKLVEIGQHLDQHSHGEMIPDGQH